MCRVFIYIYIAVGFVNFSGDHCCFIIVVIVVIIISIIITVIAGITMMSVSSLSVYH